MITTVVEDIFDSQHNLTAKRMTIYYTGQVIKVIDFPPNVPMEYEDQNNYIISKLLPLFD